MRYLGALLLVGACAAAGFARTAALRRKIALVEGLSSLVRHIRTELCQRGSPLPEMLRQASSRSPAFAHELNRMETELRAGQTAANAAAPLLEHLETQRDLPETARALADLCGVLGRYDSATQAGACDRTLEQLDLQREALRRELDEKGRLYHAVPLALGLMAALVLL